MQVLKDLKECYDDVAYVLCEYNAFNFDLAYDRGLWDGILINIDRISCAQFRAKVKEALGVPLQTRPDCLEECRTILNRTRNALHTLLQCLRLVEDTGGIVQKEDHDIEVDYFGSEHIRVMAMMAIMEGPAVKIQQETFGDRAWTCGEIQNAFSPANVSGRVAKVNDMVRGYYLFEKDTNPIPIIDFAVEKSAHRHSAARALIMEIMGGLLANGRPELRFDVEERHKPQPLEYAV